MHGISFQDDCAGTASGNRCESNLEAGIHTWQQTAPKLTSNICLHNQYGGIVAANASRPTMENNICESNNVGILFRDDAAGSATGNQCHRNDTYGIATLDRARPVVENNACHRNVGDGIIAADASKPRLKNNNTTDNHRPNPKTAWTVSGIKGGGRHSPKQFAAKLDSSVAPTMALERAARTLSQNWKTSGRLEPRPDLEDGWEFSAQQNYKGEGDRSGTVTASLISFRVNGVTMLNIAFSENGFLMWLDEQSEEVAALALYAVAIAIEDWTGEKMPWVCMEGTWIKDQTFITSYGVIQVAKY